MREPAYLFSGKPLREYLDIALRGLIKEIESLPSSKVLTAGDEELAADLIEKYSVTTPLLDEARITVDQKDTKVDVSNDPMRIAYHLNPGRPTYIDGTIFTYFVPFAGNAAVFRCRPSYYSSNFPEAAIDEQELIFAYEDTRHDTDGIRNKFAADLEETKKLLAWSDNDIRSHNENVAQTSRTKLADRRAKLTRDEQVVQQLGYALRRRTDAPETYHVPIVRKSIPLPVATRGPLEPAPISDDAYEEILRIIHSMVLVMERSPRTFKDVDEHFLRTLFLVTLNAQYEGQATGETFNYEGKTDILIRHENKNVFIAECKFWHGAKVVTETIDQILGYAQWRDTKTAILLFSRNKDFTSVLKQIPDIVKTHASYARQYEYAHESAYRFAMRQKDDEQRFVTLTITAFNIPT
jgi:hypothetical protein